MKGTAFATELNRVIRLEEQLLLPLVASSALAKQIAGHISEMPESFDWPLDVWDEITWAFLLGSSHGDSSEDGKRERHFLRMSLWRLRQAMVAP